MATKEVAKKDSGGLPAYMEKYAGQGTEDVGQEAIEIPRVSLLQALSPEIEEYDVRPGEFFHNILLEELGKSIRVTPCYINHTYLLWRPREDGGGILARAPDGIHWDLPDATFNVKLKSGKAVTWNTAPTVKASGLAEWGSEDPDDQDNNHPAATAMINCVCVMPERKELGPFVFTWQRTGHKYGKKLVGNIKMSRVPSFGRIFEFSGKKVEGQSGPYLEPRFKPDGFVDEEDFEDYAEVYRTFKAHSFSAAEERGDTGEAGDPEAAAKTEY